MDVIVLNPRKNEVGEITEGEVSVEIANDINKNVTFTIPDKDGNLLTDTALLEGGFTVSILGSAQLTNPVNNETSFKGTFIIGGFKNLDTYIGAPVDWILEISKDAGFTTIYKSFITVGITTPRVVTFEEGSLVLYARVRVRTDLHISSNSNTVKFKLIDMFVHKPSIIFPTNNAINLSPSLVVQVSDYQYIGTNNYCDSLSYQLAKDISFLDMVEENILYRDENIGEGNINDYVKHFTPFNIRENTEYYVRVAYNGIVSGISDWSDPVKFKTINLPDKSYKTTTHTFNNFINSYDKRYIVANSNIDVSIATFENNTNVYSTKRVRFTNGNITGLEVIDSFVIMDNIIVVGNLTISNSNIKKKQFIIKVKNDLSVASAKVFETQDAREVFSILFNKAVSLGNAIYTVGTVPNLAYDNNDLSAIYKLDTNLDIESYKTLEHPVIGSVVKYKNISSLNGDVLCVGSSPVETLDGIKQNGIVSIFDGATLDINTSKLFKYGENDVKFIKSIVSTDKTYILGVTTTISGKRPIIVVIDNTNLEITESIMLNIGTASDLEYLDIVLLSNEVEEDGEDNFVTTESLFRLSGSYVLGGITYSAITTIKDDIVTGFNIEKQFIYKHSAIKKDAMQDYGLVALVMDKTIIEINDVLDYSGVNVLPLVATINTIELATQLITLLDNVNQPFVSDGAVTLDTGIQFITIENI